MKAKNTVGKIYVRPNAYLGRSETFCRGFLKGRITISRCYMSVHITHLFRTFAV